MTGICRRPSATEEPPAAGGGRVGTLGSRSQRRGWLRLIVLMSLKNEHVALGSAPCNDSSGGGLITAWRRGRKSNKHWRCRCRRDIRSRAGNFFVWAFRGRRRRFGFLAATSGRFHWDWDGMGGYSASNTKPCITSNGAGGIWAGWLGEAKRGRYIIGKSFVRFWGARPLDFLGCSRGTWMLAGGCIYCITQYLKRVNRAYRENTRLFE